MLAGILVIFMAEAIAEGFKEPVDMTLAMAEAFNEAVAVAEAIADDMLAILALKAEMEALLALTALADEETEDKAEPSAEVT